MPRLESRGHMAWHLLRFVPIMGKTNKSIADTEKRRDHPVNPTDLEREETRERAFHGTPQISREEGELRETPEERDRNRVDRD
jgi:hypothetical protein